MPKIRILAVVALCLIGIGAYLAKPRVQEERLGSFFRLKVALTYKQQPVGFDIVVGCGVRIGHPLAGGTSNEVMAMTAAYYVKPISDGHAISVRSVSVGDLSSPCQGATTANGQIPPNWLPTIVWYDRAEDLSHGLAYVTEEAFYHPQAQLSFGGAVVEAATLADYDAFVASVPRNLIPDRLADWMIRADPTFYKRDRPVAPEYVADPWKAWPRGSPLDCHAMRRWKLPAAFVQRVREAWPPDRPRFWVPTGALAADLSSWISGIPGNSPRYVFRYGRDPSETGPDYPMEVFASRRDDGLSALSPQTFRDGTYYEDTAVDGPNAERGFAFCDREGSGPIFDAVTGRASAPTNRITVTCRIEGQITIKGADCMIGLYVALENDAYLLRPISAFYD